MSNINDLGFKSALVLAKLGHDLGSRMDDTVDSPIPETLKAKAARIPIAPADVNETIVEPHEYTEIDEKSLF